MQGCIDALAVVLSKPLSNYGKRVKLPYSSHFGICNYLNIYQLAKMVSFYIIWPWDDLRGQGQGQKGQKNFIAPINSKLSNLYRKLKKKFWNFFIPRWKNLEFFRMWCKFFLSPWTLCMGNNKTACNLSLGDCFQLSIDSPHVLDDFGHFSFFDLFHLFWPWWPWLEKNVNFKMSICYVCD